MSEENKSLMLSEAEIIEAINSDSLISVSLGAGQPQKNVKMSTLATVAAGMMGIRTISNKGSLTAGSTKSIDIANRSFAIVAITSWNYYWIYAVYYNGSETMTGIEISANKRTDVEISFELGKVIAKNNSSSSEYRLDMFAFVVL